MHRFPEHRFVKHRCAAYAQVVNIYIYIYIYTSKFVIGAEHIFANVLIQVLYIHLSDLQGAPLI